MLVSLINWQKRYRSRKRIAAGNRARDQREWFKAARHYGAALALVPDRATIHIQHGNMLKEAGNRTAAELAYRRALAIDTQDKDGWLQLGHVMKLMGRTSEAVEAYAQAISINPEFRAAAVELVALGASDHVPINVLNGVSIGPAAAEIAESLKALREEFEPFLRSSRSYAAFRNLYSVPPPPAASEADKLFISIEIDAVGDSAAELAATIQSIRDQTRKEWRAVCRVDRAIVEHPIASVAYIDHRISISCEETAFGGDLVVTLSAGTILDPVALAWFAFAHARTGCAASYADHDHARETWRGPRTLCKPTLQPKFDPDWFIDGLSSPSVICRDITRSGSSGSASALGIVLCQISRSNGLIVHIPRLLSTVLDVFEAIADAPSDQEGRAYPTFAYHSLMPQKSNGIRRRIAVIIPTRDQAKLLAACVERLYANAINPDRIDVIVVDNRSKDQQTFDVLDNLKRRRGVQTLTFDEPFNWSRANNLAVLATQADILLFLNNDTEMQSSAWDQIVDVELRNPEIGALGARLLYPDRTLQHAGIVFGTGDGAPRHEGVGSAEDDGGPDGRWLRRRSVAAVTGACLAMRRSVWVNAGGFDEELAVGYNDVDMALRIRSLGYRILYVPTLQLIHHESKTRGKNVTRTQVAWDRGELRNLYLRWGDRLFEDPTLNLHWSRRDENFQGYSEPSLEAIVADIDAQLSPVGKAN